MGLTDDRFGEHSIRYDWPQELLTLIIDVVPRLFHSKKQVLFFFRGAGVGSHLLNDLMGQLNADTTSLNKYQIARTVATRLLERGDTTIAERREIVKQLVQWEDYSGSYDDDRLVAKGLIASIRELVNERDTFTKMANERDRELERHKAEHLAKKAAQQKVRLEREAIKSELYALFFEPNASKRGKALEGLLNGLFKTYNILVSEAFELKGDHGEGVIEQIDGVISLDGEFYLVEMKWWQAKLGPAEVSQHLVRVFSRGQARGVLISNSGYTDAVLASCKEFLAKSVVVLCGLDEIISILETESDLRQFLNSKIKAAIVDKNPYFRQT